MKDKQLLLHRLLPLPHLPLFNLAPPHPLVRTHPVYGNTTTLSPSCCRRSSRPILITEARAPGTIRNFWRYFCFPRTINLACSRVFFKTDILKRISVLRRVNQEMGVFVLDGIRQNCTHVRIILQGIYLAVTIMEMGRVSANG